MTSRLLSGIGLTALLVAQAQQPLPSAGAPKAVLSNTGAPIRIPYQCNNEDMDWAGMSCSDEEPCPIYVELASLEPVGSRVFLSGNIHSSSTTLYSVLLASDDAGKTWSEPYDRLRGTVLDRIQFIDFETGWVSGQVQVPVAQDPFFLITSDGGKTWRKRPLFNETRAGTISEFWFSSRNQGALLLDRSRSGEDGKYEFYESMTGGESWMLREVNEKPIKMRRAPEPNADWRIHPDSASKSFRIERRQGEKWVNLASFLVGIATCKAVEAPAAEPVAPPTPAPSEPEPAPTPSRRKPPSLKKPPQ